MNTAPRAGSFTPTCTASKAPASLPRWGWMICQVRRLRFLLNGVRSLEIISPNLASKSEWSIMEVTPVEFSLNVWKCSFGARAFAVLALLTALFAAACGGVPKAYYYTLQVPAAPAPTDPRTDYVLGV